MVKMLTFDEAFNLFLMAILVFGCIVFVVNILSRLRDAHISRRKHYAVAAPTEDELARRRMRVVEQTQQIIAEKAAEVLALRKEKEQKELEEVARKNDVDMGRRLVPATHRGREEQAAKAASNGTGGIPRGDSESTEAKGAGSILRRRVNVHNSNASGSASGSSGVGVGGGSVNVPAVDGNSQERHSVAESAAPSGDDVPSLAAARTALAERLRVQEEIEKQQQINEKLAADEEKRRLREAAIASLADAIVPEPAADAPNLCRLKIRLPNGDILRRRFDADAPLQQLVDWLHVEGYDPAEFAIFTGTPKVRVGWESRDAFKGIGVRRSANNSSANAPSGGSPLSLRGAGLYPAATVYCERKA